jgi:predicted AAA+ superfamily ATPase
MIQRRIFEQEAIQALEEFPVVALLGPRQCGKTTLSRGLEAHRFDLEDPVDLARLQDPVLALAPLRGLVVLDEIQRRPDLFPYLRVLADRAGTPARFLVLGSASGELLRQGSESLAGRIRFLELSGFDLSEVEDRDKLWLRGGLPRSYLATSDSASWTWREQYLRALCERDLPQLELRLQPQETRRFLQMSAHLHGQTVGYSDLSRSLGMSDKTVKHHLGILEGAFLVRLLAPWHANLGKRLVKSPKLYWRDPGLLHSLSGVRTREAMLTHPRLGAFWEGFAMEQILSTRRGGSAWFWATHAGAEIDLLVEKGAGMWGIEFKWSSVPKVTASMRTALADLGLERILVVHPGERNWPLSDRVEATSLSKARELMGRQ